MDRCDHCLLEFPERDAVHCDVDGRTKVFCCGGCCGIYRLIHQEGLARFYDRRKWKSGGPPVFSGAKAIDPAPFVGLVRDVDKKSEIDLVIDGIRCASCVWLNEKILEGLEGIDRVRVNYITHRAQIRWDPRRVGLEKILRRIESIGYHPRPWAESEQFRKQRGETRDLLFRFGTAGFVSAQLMMLSTALYAGYFQGIDMRTKLTFETIALLLTLPVLLYSGRQLIANTISGLGRLQFTMDSLVTIGAGSAFAYSVYSMFTGGEVFFDTAAMIITLVLLGRLIESTARGKACDTVERLAGLRPRIARTIPTGGERRTVPLESVKTGDLVEVVPGERIPLDGTVRSGASEADESLVTGEARPVLKGPGAGVIGGSMNLYGTFVFEVTRTGKDTVLSGIIGAVEEARASRPRIQTTANRVVGYFVPAIFVLAASALFFCLLTGAPVDRALMTGISVLVIACPCSLGLATPLALMMFTSMASAKGILIRHGEMAENAGKTGHIVFDKTGTMTLGRPLLKETIVLDPSLSREDVIALAGAVEGLSEHSIGHAIAAARKDLTIRPDALAVSGFEAVPGKGVIGQVQGKRIVIGNPGMLSENGIPVKRDSAISLIAKPHEKEGDTVIYVGWEGALRAIMVVSDGIRDEAAAVISELRRMNCTVSIISGDNEATTGAIARRAGIGDAVSGVSPIGKKEVIARMQEKGTRVMMIGDGINDAPALAQATTGVAMGRGSDIAMESADAVLIRDDLSLIPTCIRLSRRTFCIIKQNIFWAFFYNVISIPLAFSGLLHPIVAAGAMAASSLFVVGNSLRIGKM
ncbi:MAG: copper-translocating P-type ATPase [Syntrophobacterales bacterium GWF2_56_9]|nr:MAG: copper-translocating P-type ATPase [Syntrophobacterales bacterium GWF2_56_9]